MRYFDTIKEMNVRQLAEFFAAHEHGMITEVLSIAKSSIFTLPLSQHDKEKISEALHDAKQELSASGRSAVKQWETILETKIGAKT